MASPNVLAELVNRIGSNEGEEESQGTEKTGKVEKREVIGVETNGKDELNPTTPKEKQGKFFKRSKSSDFDKSPSKKKAKGKAQKVDSDSGGEGTSEGQTHHKKKGLLSNIKSAFKKKGKQRKLSTDENKLGGKSRSENDLINANDKDSYRLRSTGGDSRHSWASGLDDIDNDDDKGEKKGKKSSFGAFLEKQKRVRDSFRNKFKIKSRKASLDAKSPKTEKGFSSQARPVSDSNLYNTSKDASFFDDSFFTVSLTNDDESFASQPESLTLGDFSSLETSPPPSENDVVKSRIQIAPKNRRKPGRYRSSKAMSDTTDNMASMSSLGMISEVTSDDDRKLSPDSAKGMDSFAVTSPGEVFVSEETPTVKPKPSRDEADGDLEQPERSNSIRADRNGPAADLSRVLTGSLSSLEKQKNSPRSSNERLGSRSSVDKAGSKNSLHEFEVKRLSLRSNSSRELPAKSDSPDIVSSGSLSAKTEQMPPVKPKPSPKPNIPKLDLNHTAPNSYQVKQPSPGYSPIKSSPVKPIPPVEKLVDTKDSRKEKPGKESKIPVQAKAMTLKLSDDSSTLISNDIKELPSEKATDASPDKQRVMFNGTVTPDSPVDKLIAQFSESETSCDSQSPSVTRPEPAPKTKTSALPVLDKSKRGQLSPSITEDLSTSADARDRSKSASGRLTSQNRVINKSSSLDDDFRSTDEKGSINRSKSVNYDPKKLRYASKTPAERDTTDTLKNGEFPDEGKPDWVSIAKDKQRKRDSMELTEPLPEETEDDSVTSATKKPLPTTDKKPEVPKKPKTPKTATSPVDSDPSSKEFVRTTRSLKIQSSASPVVDVDLRGGDSATSVANCVVCGKVAYMFGRFELNGQYFHKNCAKCSVCGNFVTADTLTLKNKSIYCRLHSDTE